MRHPILLSLSLQVVLALGCVVEAVGPGPSTTCGASGQACCGNACTAGLACVGGVCTVPATCGAAGAACCAGNVCGAGLACGTGGVCVAATTCGTAGAACCAGGVCGAGLACGAGNVCGAVVSGREPYTACTAGEACGGGTSCLPAMYTLSGNPGTLCSAACTSGPQCPPSSFFATYAPTCVVNAGTGQGLCYDTCLTNADCGGGTTCAQIPGTANRICVPPGGGAPVCGANGQPCCAGNACGAGLSCSAGLCRAVVANRQPYQKCDVGAGDVCGGGTACIPSIAQVSGKTRGSNCTVGCPSGLPNGCPGYVPGSPTPAVACANLTGNLAESQCFRLCTTQNDCLDYNTTCTAFMTTTGQVRLCVPVGPR